MEIGGVPPQRDVTPNGDFVWRGAARPRGSLGSHPKESPHKEWGSRVTKLRGFPPSPPPLPPQPHTEVGRLQLRIGGAVEGPHGAPQQPSHQRRPHHMHGQMVAACGQVVGGGGGGPLSILKPPLSPPPPSPFTQTPPPGGAVGLQLTAERVLHEGVLPDDAQRAAQRVVQTAGDQQQQQRRDALQQLQHLRAASCTSAAPRPTFIAPPPSPPTPHLEPRQPLTTLCSSRGCMAMRHGKMTAGLSARRSGSSVRLF